MKAKPRWMKSVIETAAKYAHSSTDADPRDSAAQAAKPAINDQA